MFIDEDGILQIKMLEGSNITLEKIKEIYDQSQLLAENAKVLALIDGSSDYDMSDEAKKYAAGEEALKNRVATAIVTNSITNRLMINLYIKFYKPLVPTKMFSDKDAAIKWLKTFYIMPGDKFYRKKR